MFAALSRIKSAQVILVVFAMLLAFVLGVIAALFGGVPALVLFSPILVLLLLLVDYRVGVVVLMVIIVFQNTPFLPSFTGFNIVNYVIAGTFGIAVLGKLFDRRTHTPNFPSYFWWAYIIPVLIAGLIGTTHLTEIPDGAFERLGHAYESQKSYLSTLVFKPFFLIVLAWLIGTAVLRSKNPRLFLIPFAIAVALPAVAIVSFVLALGLDLQLLSSPHGREILSNLGLHANELGFLLATGFVMLLYVLPTIESGWGKLFLIAVLVLVSIAQLLTFSRGGYLIYFLGGLLFLISRKKMPYIFAGLSIAILLALILPDAFWERITTGVDDTPSDLSVEGNDALTAGRVWLWEQLWPSFLASPVWGSGLDSAAWSNLVKSGIVTVNHPHNIYLRILLDMGVIGFFLLSVWLVRLLKDIRNISLSESVPPQFRSLAMGLRAALAGTLVAGFTNGHFTPHTELAYFWIAIGLLLPYITIENRNFTAKDAVTVQSN